MVLLSPELGRAEACEGGPTPPAYVAASRMVIPKRKARARQSAATAADPANATPPYLGSNANNFARVVRVR
jgi:hypothetical protein